MQLTLCSRMPEFTASPQPPIDRKQKCDQRHKDEERPVGHKQRLFREYIQIPGDRCLIASARHVDLHFPLTGRGQIQMRYVQGFVRRGFVSRGKR